MSPGLNFKATNTLDNDGSEIPVNLTFKSMADFEPARIVEQVPALKKLLEARNELRDLLSKADRSENLEDLLDRILQNQQVLRQLSGELGIGTAGPAGTGERDSDTETPG
jgi:type VI secretion system protein ImpB